MQYEKECRVEKPDTKLFSYSILKGINNVNNISIIATQIFIKKTNIFFVNLNRFTLFLTIKIKKELVHKIILDKAIKETRTN